MSHPILVTGAAGGQQGSTGRVVATLLLEQGLPVCAFVHKFDARSDELRQKGAEIIEGDLLNPVSVQAAMKDVKRAYFTYPVADGLLEAGNRVPLDRLRPAMEDWFRRKGYLKPEERVEIDELSR